MKIVKLETFIARVAYKHVETSSLINRGGITDVIVKLTTQDGLVGWGECTRAADTAGIESAVQAHGAARHRPQHPGTTRQSIAILPSTPSGRSSR